MLRFILFRPDAPAGAPVTPAPPAAPGAPAQSSVEAASAAARAAIAATGSAIPPTAAPAALPPRIGAGVPEGGQFTTSQVRELPGETLSGTQPTNTPTSAPVPGAPSTGQQPPAAQPPAPGTEAPPATETPVEGAEGQGDDPLAVELPIAVGDGEEPFVIQAADEATATQIREFVERAVSNEATALQLDQASRQLDQFAEFRLQCDLDPDGVAIDLVRDNPQAAERLVLSLLTSNRALLTTLAPKLAKLGDPNQFAQVALEATTARQSVEAQAAQRLQNERAVQANVKEIDTILGAIVNTQEIPPQLQQRIFQDMRRDIADFAGRRNLLTLPSNQVLDVVAERLAALGLDTEAATARAIAVLAKRGPGSTPAARAGLVTRRAATPTQRPPAPPAARPGFARPSGTAPRNGQAFLASAARRTAAAIPAGGAGSPSNAPPTFTSTKADGSTMSIQEAIAAHRQRVASGQRSY